MKIKHVPSIGLAAAAFVCLSAANNIQAAGHTYHFANLASGNWNKLNQRQANSYQIGFSASRPQTQAAYFEFDLTPAKNKTVTDCNVLIIGSTDYHISDIWTGHPPGQTANQFKVGIAPQYPLGHPFSVSQITTGNNIPDLFQQCISTYGNPHLGYRRIADGLHQGTTFDAFHFDSTSGRQRVQSAVNAGGTYVLWARDEDDNGNDGQNYIWGSTSFNVGNTLNLTTSN